METQTLDFVLTSPQFRKFNKGDGFQLNYHQLVNHTGTHHAELKMSKPNYKKLLSSIKGKRGFRFSKGMIIDGSLLDHQKQGSGFRRKHYPKEYVKLGLDDDDVDEDNNGNVKESDDGNMTLSGGKLLKGSVEMKKKWRS